MCKTAHNYLRVLQKIVANKMKFNKGTEDQAKHKKLTKIHKKILVINKKKR